MSTMERARKNTSIILQGVATVGLEPIAREIGCDQSTVSRMKEKAEQFAKMLAVSGLKVVPAHYRCAKPEVISALQTLAGEAMRSEKSRELVWDDE